MNVRTGDGDLANPSEYVAKPLKILNVPSRFEANGIGEDLLMWYMRQIGLAKLLRPEEEIELGRSIALARRVIKESNPERTRFLREVIRRGNKARERMIAANLRLVVNVSST